MPLKFYFIILFICFFSFSLEAKEARSPCLSNNKPCSDFSKTLGGKSSELALKFEQVVDGDTFVAGGRTIRIWGIDAPAKSDPAYRVSGWLLQSLIEEKVLNCKLISLDKYKRAVMQCRAGDLDIGSVMVKFGMAKDYKHYSAGYYQPEEKEAIAKKRGIWSDN